MGEILSYRKFLKTYKTRGHRIRHLENYKYLFPINSNPPLAGIVGDLIGDGHLQADPKWRMDFTSKNIGELKRFEKEISCLFGVYGKIRACSSNKYGKTHNLAVNSAPVARILWLCGVPPGQKVLNPFGIPNWIKKDKSCFKRFCQRIFTCEGGLSHEKTRKMPRIRLEMWKSIHLIEDGQKFMKDISLLMSKYFKINSTVLVQNKENLRKDGIITKPIRLSLLSDSIIKFYDKIGFEGAKQKSLKALISK